MKTILPVLALALASTAPSLAQSYAVTNGRVVTNSDQGILANGTVLVRDGNIVAVGTDVSIPNGTEIIDANGGWITPGLFAPYTQIGLIEVALEGSTTDAGADDSPYSVALDVSDGFNPMGTHIASTRMRGITRAAIYPSTGHNIFAGQGALVETGGDANSVFQSGSFVFADLSQSGASTAGGSRPAAWAFLEAAFSDARGYPGRFSADHQGDALNRYDAQALLPVVRGRMPLVLNIDRAVDLHRAIRFQAENAPVQIIIEGGAEAWMVADELAAAGIPVMLDPLRNLPASFD